MKKGNNYLAWNTYYQIINKNGWDSLSYETISEHYAILSARLSSIVEQPPSSVLISTVGTKTEVSIVSMSHPIVFYLDVFDAPSIRVESGVLRRCISVVPFVSRFTTRKLRKIEVFDVSIKSGVKHWYRNYSCIIASLYKAGIFTDQMIEEIIQELKIINQTKKD